LPEYKGTMTTTAEGSALAAIRRAKEHQVNANKGQPPKDLPTSSVPSHEVASVAPTVADRSNVSVTKPPKKGFFRRLLQDIGDALEEIFDDFDLLTTSEEKEIVPKAVEVKQETGSNHLPKQVAVNVKVSRGGSATTSANQPEAGTSTRADEKV
jgi:hypothetical protein